MVFIAMEDRGLPQDIGIRLQSRRLQAQDGRTANKFDSHIRHHELADILDDNDQANLARSATIYRLHEIKTN